MPGGDTLDAKVSRQSEQAIRDADAVIMVMDAITGVTEEDSRVAEVIRNLARGKVLLVVNKVDDANREGLIWEALSLGLGDPLGISALHGRGAGDVLDRLIEVLPQPEPVDEVPDDEEPEEDRVFSVALVGRPNVGKSTLFNRLIGEDRAVVHDLPGTTRDTVDTIVDTDEGPIRFVDTAGMRRKAKIDEATEYYSLVRALQAVDKADVALLVIDSTVGVTAPGPAAGRADRRRRQPGRGPAQQARAPHGCRSPGRPRLPGQGATALHRGGAGAEDLSPHRARAWASSCRRSSMSIEDYHRRVPTRRVNEVIRAAQQAQPGPHGVKVLYATQAATDPPTFTLFANREVPATYLRYLERSLREGFDIGRHADQDAGAEALLADAASGGTGASSQDRAIAVSRSAKRSSSSSVVM